MDSNTQPQYSENNNQVWECLPTTSNYVDQIAFSPDGKIVASLHTYSPKWLKIWDLVSGELLYAANWVELLKIAGVELEDLKTSSRIYNNEVRRTISLYFHPDGNTLVYTFHGMVLIYDLERGKVVRGKSVQSPFDPSYFGLPDNVFVSPDLQIAATTHYGHTNLWEISTETKIHTLFVDFKENINQYIGQFSADGKIYASLMMEPDLGTRRLDKETIKVWEVETGVEVCSITLPDVYAQYTSVIALNSDGRILASNSGDKDKTVIVLSETITGEEICRFQDFESQDLLARKSVGLRKFISSAFDKFVSIFSPVRRQMLIMLRKNRIIWGLGLGLITRSQKVVSLIIWRLGLGLITRSKDQQKVVSLTFSPNDQLLASGNITGTINLWQLKKGSLEPPTKIWTWTIVSRQPIKTLVFSQDGQTLATGQGDDNGAITLWDVKSGKKLQPLPGHTVRALRVSLLDPSYSSSFSSYRVAVSPDGKIIATNYDMIKLWDAQTGSCLRCLESKSDWRFAHKITFSPRGKFLVSTYWRDIVLWKVSTGEEIQSMRPDPDYVYGSYDERWSSRTLNQYGDLLAISEKSTDFHNVNLQIMQIPTGKIVCTLVTEDEFPQQIIFSPDKRFVATRHNIAEFAIWEIATGNLIRTIITDNVGDDTHLPDPVVFSANGEILAISGTANITLWQVSSGEKIHTINRYYRGLGACLAFSSDGQTLAFTENIFTDDSMTEALKLWDVKTTKEICILAQGIYGITSLDFSGNGQVLVIGYANSTISVWQQKKDLA